MTCSQTAPPMKYSQAVSQQPLQTTSTPIPAPPKTTQKSILSQLTTPPPQTTGAEDRMLEPQEQKSVQKTQPSSSTFQGTVADHSPKNQAKDSVKKTSAIQLYSPKDSDPDKSRPEGPTAKLCTGSGRTHKHLNRQREANSNV
ncbi:hypothetical protein Pmani_023483 [Petrolisthes manimaculis]|uniref:Uncharacterized protein n=1 Tax=Petrolisthes manimaculis TaxID=1843537 RepID=A0AAE1P9L2_9EUCA|nr:hypothetical protein Pmani_023483 [Petrolisthes manimaculis]